MSGILVYGLLWAANFLLALATLLGELYRRDYARAARLRAMLRRLEELDPISSPSSTSRWERLDERLRERYYWLPSALFALFMLVAFVGMLVLGLRAHSSLTFSSPYPEIAVSFLALSALILAFSIYRFTRRRAHHLATAHDPQ